MEMIGTAPTKRLVRALTVGLAVGCALIGTGAKAQLTLNALGIADGFTLSTFYSDPAANYGILGAVAGPGGTAIASGFARNEIYKFNDVDGQTFASKLLSTPTGVGSPTGIASLGGNVYVGIVGGTYYSVNTTTLALTPLALATPLSALYGLWGNPVSGHLVAGTSNLGLVDINPGTGSVVQVGRTGNLDGVSVSPNGAIAYAEYDSNSILGYSLTSPDPTTPVFQALGLPGPPDGTGVISGGLFDGDLIVDNNDGTIGLINHLTGVESIIASGGARGDLVSPDVSNGTLILTTSDSAYRLTCGPGCTFGPSVVPEPASIALWGLGLAALGFVRRRQSPR